MKRLLPKIGLSLMATVVTLGSLEVGARIHDQAFRKEADSAAAPAAATGKGLDPNNPWPLYRDLSRGNRFTDRTFNIYYFGGSTTATRHLQTFVDQRDSLFDAGRFVGFEQ